VKFSLLFALTRKACFSECLYEILRKEEKKKKLFKQLMTNSCYYISMMSPSRNKSLGKCTKKKGYITKVNRSLRKKCNRDSVKSGFKAPDLSRRIQSCTRIGILMHWTIGNFII